MSWEMIYLLSGAAILPVFVVAIIITINVKVQIAKYSAVHIGAGVTAKQLVERVAAQEKLSIRVENASKAMGDHYDPRAQAVRLTPEVYNSDSIAALAIAAHECGHALQDEQNYFPLKVRQLVVNVSNFTSRLLSPLIILGMIASAFVLTVASMNFLKWVLLACCIIYGLSALVNFITLPTEFDASQRGLELLQKMGLITAPETKQAAKKVLSAAANTYVVAFALSLLYFLWHVADFILIFGDHRR